MARRLTRRLQRLHDGGLVPAELLAAAAHEADLLEHPFVGLEHLELARLRCSGEHNAYELLRSNLTPGARRPWWHIRSPRSALRPAGLRATRMARQRAEGDK